MIVGDTMLRGRQDRWADGRAWTVSWMSMNRIDQYPGRGSGSSCRHQKTPANVTTAAASQMITPTARTHGVDSDDITMRPAMATASPTYPTRSAQTAILQCPLDCSSGGSCMPGSMRAPRLRGQGVPLRITVGRRLRSQEPVGPTPITSTCASRSAKTSTPTGRTSAGQRGLPASELGVAHPGG
jgi:hypothetical protein